MKLKKALLLVLIGLIIYFTYLSISGNPLIIELSKGETNLIQSANKFGDTIMPLKELDFKQGNWKAYLLISSSDNTEIIENFKSGGCYQTNNVEILEKLKQKLLVTYTGGDMATVESRFVILKNGKKIFDMGIVLDKYKEGLQSKSYGWLEAKEKTLSNQLILFSKVHNPFIVL